MTNVGANYTNYNYYNYGIDNSQNFFNYGIALNPVQNYNNGLGYNYLDNSLATTYNQMDELLGDYSQPNTLGVDYDPMQQIMEWIMAIMQNFGMLNNNGLNQNNTQNKQIGQNKEDKQALADELQARWNNGDHSKEVGDAIHQLQSEGMSSTSSGESLHDPYEVNIDGEKYVFVADKNKNGKIDKEAEILGFNDTKDNLFADMKKLDANHDGKVDKSEMDKAGVKLAKVGQDGKVNLAQTKDVNSVDINSFSKNKNFKGAGEAGTFNVNLADGKNVKGKEVFEEMQQILQLLTV
ncbi:MAG: hypothetical protein AB1782_07340 [Cyanobacteriota bacterium]